MDSRLYEKDQDSTLRTQQCLPATLPAKSSLTSQPSESRLSTISCTTTITDLDTVLLKTFLPIVIPQTSRSLRGVHYSSFLRAYPATLTYLGINKAEFIRSIDNLNEAFISSPFFYALTVIGSTVSFVPDLAAQIVGSVLATVSEFACIANSKLRTKSFVKSANKKIFEPRGLQIRILNTENMLKAIHVDKEAFKLPPLPETYVPDITEEDTNEQEDPRRRWLQALDTVIAPLEYTPSDFTEQDNWLKKAGAWTAKRQDKKKAKALNKRRDKAQKAVEVAEEEAIINQKSIQDTLDGLQAQLETLTLRQTLAGTSDPTVETQKQRDLLACEAAIRTQQMKLIDEEIKKNEATEKAIAKVDKKKQKIVQKIRWIVITAASGEEVADGDIDDGVEDVRDVEHA